MMPSANFTNKTKCSSQKFKEIICKYTLGKWVPIRLSTYIHIYYLVPFVIGWKIKEKRTTYSGGNGNRGEIGFAYFLAILPFYEKSCIWLFI